MLSMNHAPKILDQSEGAWRRLKYIRFDVIIKAGGAHDKLATEVLETEGGGVLNWCLRGLGTMPGADEKTIKPALVDSAEDRRRHEGVSRTGNATVRFFDEHLVVKDS